MRKFLPMGDYSLGEYRHIQQVLSVQGDKYNNAGLQGALRAQSRNNSPKLELRSEDKKAFWILIVLWSNKQGTGGGDIKKLSMFRKFQVILYCFSYLIYDMENIRVNLARKSRMTKRLAHYTEKLDFNE